MDWAASQILGGLLPVHDCSDSGSVLRLETSAVRLRKSLFVPGETGTAFGVL